MSRRAEPSADSDRGAKPPFYKNVVVRHPVLAFMPLPGRERDELAELDPVVIMGRGHSGTRVVAWMVHHLGVDLGVDDERTPSGDPVDRSLRHHLRIVAERSIGNGATEAPGFLETNRFQRAMAGHLRRRGVPVVPLRWGWKFPESYLTGPVIAQTFPGARFIHLVRDGRDLAFKRHLTDIADHRLARRILAREGATTAPHHLQAAKSWAFQVERFVEFAASLPDDRLLTIRYEELVIDPLGSVVRIADFLGVESTTAATRYASMEVSARDVASHRRYDAEQLRAVEEAIGPTLRRFGYLESDIP